MLESGRHIEKLCCGTASLLLRPLQLVLRRGAWHASCCLLIVLVAGKSHIAKLALSSLKVTVLFREMSYVLQENVGKCPLKVVVTL